MRPRIRAFTLIELLVVIAIIAILSAVVIASLNNARSKGTNASESEQIGQYFNALQLYALDHGGGYPYPGNDDQGYCLGRYPSGACGNAQSPISETAFIDDAFLPYISGLPPGPSFTTPGGFNWSGYVYGCLQDNGTYCTRARIVWFIQGVTSSCARGAAATPNPAAGVTQCVLTTL